MVGYRFMGRTHGHAYTDIPAFFPEAPTPLRRVICGRDPGALGTVAEEFGWERAVTDWREVVESDDVDIVDIAGPGNIHHDVALAAAAAGKHIFCEKPLANTLAEARAMKAAAELAGVTTMVGFNYRFAPAVQLAHRLLKSGRFGRLFHIRSQFLQDWIIDPEYPLVWRLRKEAAGSGALGDLGAHMIDMARFLVGEFESVTADLTTFIKERPLPPAGAPGPDSGGAGRGGVTVDDAAVFLARLSGGVMGVFEATRFAPGRRCAQTFEVSGSKGSLRWDFERMNELEVYFVDDDADVQGFRRINVNDLAHPYGGRWWPPGHGIGYDVTFVHELADFLVAVGERRATRPDFADGVRCQQVLEAVERSASERSWVDLDDG